MRFPPRKTPVALKHRAISRQEKLAFSTPVGLSWDSLPLPQSLCGRMEVRMYGRTDVRTDGHVTITSQTKFLGLIGYHISLAMELRWRALPAGSTNIHPFSKTLQLEKYIYTYLSFVFTSRKQKITYENKR